MQQTFNTELRSKTTVGGFDRRTSKRMQVSYDQYQHHIIERQRKLQEKYKCGYSTLVKKLIEERYHQEFTDLFSLRWTTPELNSTSRTTIHCLKMSSSVMTNMHYNHEEWELIFLSEYRLCMMNRQIHNQSSDGSQVNGILLIQLQKWRNGMKNIVHLLEECRDRCYDHHFISRNGGNGKNTCTEF